jgi:hypothetical protein
MCRIRQKHRALVGHHLRHLGVKPFFSKSSRQIRAALTSSVLGETCENMELVQIRAVPNELAKVIGYFGKKPSNNKSFLYAWKRKTND